MLVVCRDEQFPVVAWQGAQRGCVGIEERTHDAAKGRLCRSLFARQHEGRIETTIPQAGKHPSHDKNEIFITDVEEMPQYLDRPARYRDRQWPHAGGPAETDRRLPDDASSRTVDLYRPPRIISEIDVDLLSMARHPDR